MPQRTHMLPHRDDSLGSRDGSLRERSLPMASASPRRAHSFYEGGIRSPAIHRSLLSPTGTTPRGGLPESPVAFLPHGLVEGARVHTISSNMFGTVRYVGDIRDRSGTWVGVELDMPSGKNSGEGPDGEKLFHCMPYHGLFVRPDKVTVLHDMGAGAPPPPRATPSVPRSARLAPAPPSVPPPPMPDLASSFSLLRPRTPSALKKPTPAAVDTLVLSSPLPVLPKGLGTSTTSTSIPTIPQKAATSTPFGSHSLPSGSASTNVPELSFGSAGLTDQALMELTAENVLQSEVLRETIAEEVKEQARRLARAEVQGVEVKLEQLQKILEEKLEKEVRQQARAEMREVQAKMGKEMEAMSAYVIEKLQHMETQVAKALEAGASEAAKENKTQAAAFETHQNALLMIQQLAMQTKTQILAGMGEQLEES